MKDNHSLFIDVFNLQILMDKQSVYTTPTIKISHFVRHIGKRADPGYQAVPLIVLLNSVFTYLTCVQYRQPSWKSTGEQV